MAFTVTEPAKLNFKENVKENYNSTSISSSYVVIEEIFLFFSKYSLADNKKKQRKGKERKASKGKKTSKIQSAQHVRPSEQGRH